MTDVFAQVGFLRPLWLLAVPVLALLINWLARRGSTAGWRRYLAADKIDHLIIGNDSRNRRQYWLLQLAAIVCCVALAGPHWQRSTAEYGAGRQPLVVLFDLSPSMQATDVRPNRVTLAQLKLIDLLRQRVNRETALVAYAGTAHRVAPLSDDPATLETLVPVLTPQIMPVAGSNPARAVALALILFEGAGVAAGDLLLISDGIDDAAVAEIDQLLDAQWRLSALAVGIDAQVPIPLADGGFLLDAREQTVLVPLQHSGLQQLARNHAGRFSLLSADDSDLRYLQSLPERIDRTPGISGVGARDTRHDIGFWLVIVLLPVALLGFRRHVLWCLMALIVMPEPASAIDWQRLWLRADQQAAQALAGGDAGTASELFEHAEWAAIARYRHGEYRAAARYYRNAASASDFYNLGNALAMAGALSEATEAYRQSLLLNADNPDALFNLALIEKLLAPPDNDDSRQQRAGNGSDDEQQTVANDDEPAQQQRRSDVQQREAGGAVASGQSLDQSALTEGGQSGVRADPGGEQIAEPADDATPVASPELAAVPDIQQGQPASNNEVAVELNDNPVLNPYSEQWLRELPQDPGGYLRRKFHYQQQLRELNGEADAPDSMRY